MRVLLALIVSAVASHACAADPSPLADKEKPLRALILTGRNNHDWKSTTPILQKTFESGGRFTVEVITGPKELTAEKLAGRDVLVCNWNAWPNREERSWGDQVEKAVLDFVRGGGGMVFIHVGTCSFYNWEEFQKLAGGAWGKNTSHGPGNEPILVTATASDHPIVKGMPPLVIADELWRNVAWQSDVTVLARGKSMDPKSKPTAEGGEPVAVCTLLGKGRGYFLVLGHGPKTMENVGWKTLLLRGTEWAASGRVTVPIPENWPAPPAESK